MGQKMISDRDIVQIHITGQAPTLLPFSRIKKRLIRPIFGRGVMRDVHDTLLKCGTWQGSVGDITVQLYINPPQASAANVEAVLARYEF